MEEDKADSRDGDFASTQQRYEAIRLKEYEAARLREYQDAMLRQQSQAAFGGQLGQRKIPLGAGMMMSPPRINADGSYNAVNIKVLKNGYEVEGFVFHSVLQLAHWLGQNLAPVEAVSSQMLMKSGE